MVLGHSTQHFEFVKFFWFLCKGLVLSCSLVLGFHVKLILLPALVLLSLCHPRFLPECIVSTASLLCCAFTCAVSCSLAPSKQTWLWCIFTIFQTFYPYVHHMKQNIWSLFLLRFWCLLVVSHIPHRSTIQECSTSEKYVLSYTQYLELVSAVLSFYIFVQTLGPWLLNEKQNRMEKEDFFQLSTFQFFWCLWLTTAFIIILQQLSLGHLCTLTLTLASTLCEALSGFSTFLDNPHIPIAYASFPTTLSCVWRNKQLKTLCLSLWFLHNGK